MRSSEVQQRNLKSKTRGVHDLLKHTKSEYMGRTRCSCKLVGMHPLYFINFAELMRLANLSCPKQNSKPQDKCEVGKDLLQ